MCFGDYQRKLISNEDWIGNLPEHFYYQNINLSVLRRGMSNFCWRCSREANTVWASYWSLTGPVKVWGMDYWAKKP